MTPSSDTPSSDIERNRIMQGFLLAVCGRNGERTGSCRDIKVPYKLYEFHTAYDFAEVRNNLFTPELEELSPNIRNKLTNR